MRQPIILTILLLFSGTGAAASSTYKESISLKVFDRLVQARGDFGMPRPKMEFIYDPQELARFQGQTIYLGEKAYDLCIGFGADSLNALAILLSHELVHYYAGHSWEEEFSREFASMDMSQEVKGSWLEDEVQADLWGGLLAYSAGYDVHDVAVEFFPKLYAAYGLKESLTGYQKMSERVLLAVKTGEKIQTLVHLFETANYLVALGMYEDALAYYQFILKEGYRSRELYNNMGVYYAQAALALFRKSELAYGFPFELDAEARIGQSIRGTSWDSPKEQREKLIQEALTHFEMARSLDPGYLPALINQACAHALMGVSVAQEDEEEASLLYDQATLLTKRAEREAKTNPTATTDLLVLKGLLSVLQGDSEGARVNWEKAGSQLAKTNLHVLEKGAFSPAGTRLPRSMERETIEGQSLDLFMRQKTCDTLIGLTVENRQAKWGISQKSLNLKNSVIFLHDAGPVRSAALHITKPGYDGQTQLGIKIGDASARVLETYKTPDAVVQLTNGEFLCYPAREILFRIDAQGRVAGWCVFRK